MVSQLVDAHLELRLGLEMLRQTFVNLFSFQIFYVQFFTNLADIDMAVNLGRASFSLVIVIVIGRLLFQILQIRFLFNAYIVRPLQLHNMWTSMMVDFFLALFVHYIILKGQLSRRVVREDVVGDAHLLHDVF